jgi:hypothetical protein
LRKQEAARWDRTRCPSLGMIYLPEKVRVPFL